MTPDGIEFMVVNISTNTFNQESMRLLEISPALSDSDTEVGLQQKNSLKDVPEIGMTLDRPIDTRNLSPEETKFVAKYISLQNLPPIENINIVSDTAFNGQKERQIVVDTKDPDNPIIFVHPNLYREVSDFSEGSLGLRALFIEEICHIAQYHMNSKFVVDASAPSTLFPAGLSNANPKNTESDILLKPETKLNELGKEQQAKYLQLQVIADEYGLSLMEAFGPGGPLESSINLNISIDEKFTTENENSLSDFFKKPIELPFFGPDFH